MSNQKTVKEFPDDAWVIQAEMLKTKNKGDIFFFFAFSGIRCKQTSYSPKSKSLGLRIFLSLMGYSLILWDDPVFFFLIG